MLYYDKPAEGLGGTWALDVESGAATIVSPDAGIFSPDTTKQAIPDPRSSVLRIRDLMKGGETRVRLAASTVTFSPGGDLLLYTIRPVQTTGGPLLQPVEVGMVSADGSGARRLASLVGASVIAWLPDGGGALLSGRASAGVDPGIWLLTLPGGLLTELRRQNRVSGFQLSPNGAWLAYLATFQKAPDDSGLNLLNVATGEHRVLGFPGSYRWAPDSRSLITIPLRAGAAVPYEVHELALESSQDAPLTTAAQVNLRIANYDWDLSPDGRRITYVSSDDYAIWLLQLRP